MIDATIRSSLSPPGEKGSLPFVCADHVEKGKKRALRLPKADMLTEARIKGRFYNNTAFRRKSVFD